MSTTLAHRFAVGDLVRVEPDKGRCVTGIITFLNPAERVALIKPAGRNYATAVFMDDMTLRTGSRSYFEKD